MSVYFIQAGKDGPVKIGHAMNARQRLRELQVAHHTKLVLLAVEEGGEPREAELHRLFSDFRMHGEWFSPVPQLVEYISHLPAHAPEQRDRKYRIGVSQLAKALGITHGAVSQWRRIPAERAVEIERVTGIPRSQLRPDLWPEPEQSEAQP